ncbi:MAG: hypothetical protein ACLR4Z_00210 [Butyricicoccaceae bacterium]
MDKDKNGVVIKVIKGVGFAVALFIIIPAITAIIVSVSLFPCLETSNDWIGFLGSYLGSILRHYYTPCNAKDTCEQQRITAQR